MKVLFLIVLMLVVGAAYAVEAAMVSVDVTILSQNQCKFNTSAAALNFGTLDPATPVDVTVSATLVIRCVGKDPVATFSLSDDDGLNESGPNLNRMRHASLAEYLPYSFSLNPATATIPKNTNYNITVSGTVRGVDYRSASVGDYSDTVTVSILP